MSYAGPSRSHGSHRPATAASASASASASRSSRSAPPPVPRPTHASDWRDDTDWRQVALFGAGLALGILLGAGSALLAAPRTGAETRAALTARAGRLRRSTSRRGQDVWDDLRDEFQGARQALHRRKRRRTMEREMAAYEGE